MQSLPISTCNELIEIVRRDVQTIEINLNSAFTMENAETELNRMNEQIEKDKKILHQLDDYIKTIEANIQPDNKGCPFDEPNCSQFLG